MEITNETGKLVNVTQEFAPPHQRRANPIPKNLSKSLKKIPKCLNPIQDFDNPFQNGITFGYKGKDSLRRGQTVLWGSRQHFVVTCKQQQQ